MASKVTPVDIANFNQLYYKYHTYAAVARETGFSASTVSKYIDKNWKPVNKALVKHFTLDDLPEPDLDWLTSIDNLGDVCVLTENEEAELREFWEELEQ